MARQEASDCMRAANNAREKLKKTQTQLERLQAGQHATAQNRIIAAEKINAERSWMAPFRPAY
jgi:hypothetical protein